MSNEWRTRGLSTKTRTRVNDFRTPAVNFSLGDNPVLLTRTSPTRRVQEHPIPYDERRSMLACPQGCTTGFL
jgi:hypothetical protein